MQQPATPGSIARSHALWRQRVSVGPSWSGIGQVQTRRSGTAGDISRYGYRPDSAPGGDHRRLRRKSHRTLPGPPPETVTLRHVRPRVRCGSFSGEPAGVGRATARGAADGCPGRSIGCPAIGRSAGSRSGLADSQRRRPRCSPGQRSFSILNLGLAVQVSAGGEQLDLEGQRAVWRDTAYRALPVSQMGRNL